MSVYIGSARLDERGKISGGAAGDQTGKEVSYQTWYLHSKGWVVLRAKSEDVAKKIAYAMRAACDNNNIGYDQYNRSGLYNAVKNLGFDPAKCNIKTETDCSALIRVCVAYASGKTIPDFNTSSELKVLKNTGLFNVYTDDKHCKSSANLLPGDILVTKTKGHTVAVIQNPATTNNTTPITPPSSNSDVKVASPTLRKGNKNTNVKTLQSNLNKVMGTNLEVDGIFGNATLKALKDFQKKYGLVVDGIYGSKSAAKMKELLQK